MTSYVPKCKPEELACEYSGLTQTADEQTAMLKVRIIELEVEVELVRTLLDELYPKWRMRMMMKDDAQ